MIGAAAGILLLVAGLLFLNGVFVSSEFSFLGAARSRLEPLARSGSTAARGVLALTGNLRALDRSLTTAQIGITFVSLGLGMYGEHAVAELVAPLFLRFGAMTHVAAHGLASTVSLVGLTSLHIVLGEQLPKAIALQYPVRTALVVQAPIRVAMLLLAPFIFILDRASNAVLHLLRVPMGDHVRAHTTEEIEILIQESAGGVLGDRQAGVLLNLLDLQDLMVRKLMIPRTRVVAFEVGAGSEEVMEAVRRTRFTRYPVYQGTIDRVIGFVHARDLLGALSDGQDLDLRSLLLPIPHVPETALARHLLRELRLLHTQIAVVLDEHGGTAGIATLEDLVEEIFGEVQDEYDVETPAVERVSERVAVVDGSLRVDEANEALDLALPEDAVDTIGGLVLQELGRTARVGDIVQLGPVTMKVLSVRGFAVTRVRVEVRGSR
ncbi:MAG: hemolysin family protein [Acidobacteriota bacterium]